MCYISGPPGLELYSPAMCCISLIQARAVIEKHQFSIWSALLPKSACNRNKSNIIFAIIARPSNVLFLLLPCRVIWLLKMKHLNFVNNISQALARSRMCAWNISFQSRLKFIIYILWLVLSNLWSINLSDNIIIITGPHDPRDIYHTVSLVRLANWVSITLNSFNVFISKV